MSCLAVISPLRGDSKPTCSLSSLESSLLCLQRFPQGYRCPLSDSVLPVLPISQDSAETSRQIHTWINHCFIPSLCEPWVYHWRVLCPFLQHPGSSCEVVPPQAALGGSGLAHRHLLPDHRAGSFCQLPGVPPLRHPLGPHQPPEAEPLRQPPGGAAQRAVIR